MLYTPLELIIELFYKDLIEYIIVLCEDINDCIQGMVTCGGHPLSFLQAIKPTTKFKMHPKKGKRHKIFLNGIIKINKQKIINHCDCEWNKYGKPLPCLGNLQLNWQNWYQNMQPSRVINERHKEKWGKLEIAHVKRAKVCKKQTKNTYQSIKPRKK